MHGNQMEKIHVNLKNGKMEKIARYSDHSLSLVISLSVSFTVFSVFADFHIVHIGDTSAYDLSHYSWLPSSGSLPNSLLYVWIVENRFPVTVWRAGST